MERSSPERSPESRGVGPETVPDVPEWLRRLEAVEGAVRGKHMLRKVIVDTDDLPLLVVLTFDEDLNRSRAMLEGIVRRIGID